MPAPAPCASTKQAVAAGGSWSNAETLRVSSIARVSRSAMLWELKCRELSWLNHRDAFPGGFGSVGSDAVLTARDVVIVRTRDQRAIDEQLQLIVDHAQAVLAVRARRCGVVSVSQDRADAVHHLANVDLVRAADGHGVVVLRIHIARQKPEPRSGGRTGVGVETREGNDFLVFHRRAGERDRTATRVGLRQRHGIS